jgi:ubiquinone/menaquinone biosynthesis C-methylase UbiE
MDENEGNASSEVDVQNDYDNSKFNKRDYWDERFKDEVKYDWLMEYQHVEKELVSLVKPEDRILIVGCGNSTFSRSMYDAGFHNIVNIDYSKVVIEHMSAANAECEGMSWLEMDMTNLTFEDSSFDVVIDKAAMDALAVDEGDVWDPEVSVIQNVHRMCVGIRRVLKTGGTHIQISFAQPHFRTKYLMGYRHSGAEVSPYESHQGHADIYRWDLSFRTINKGAGSLDSFMYIMNTTE